MDNTEYTIKRDEIRALIAKKKYVQAAEIADTIDWRRIRSVMMLCIVSDLYKVNRRYEDARNVMQLAYDIRPGGRSICYSLCELSIKLDEFVQAMGYYKEFVQIAPRDPDCYVLRYRLCEAQDVSLEERIEILKKLKQKEYREKWAYELAYLYHRIGQSTLCVEECDELILWFGDGKYVYKAMELKMQSQPLSPSQQEKYDHRFDDIQPQKTADRPYRGDALSQGREQNPPETAEPPQRAPEAAEPEQAAASPAPPPQQSHDQKPAEQDIQVKIMNVGQYDTMNLQAELAAGLQEVLGKEDRANNRSITQAILAPLLESDTEKLDLPDEEEIREEPFEDVEEVEVFFGETGEMKAIPPDVPQGETPDVGGDTRRVPDLTEQDTKIFEIRHLLNETAEAPDETAKQVLSQMQAEQRNEEQVMTAQPPRELAEVLSQESDGQISLVVPEREAVEKQITGQMSITDILAEWERRKQENAKMRKEEVRQRILQQTDSVFTEFETALRDELQEKLDEDQASEEMFELEESEGTESDEWEVPEEPERMTEWELPEEPEEPEELEEPEASEESEELEEPEASEEPEEAAEEPEAEEKFGETAEWELPEELESQEELEEPEVSEEPETSEEPEASEELEEPAEESEAPEDTKDEKQEAAKKQDVEYGKWESVDEEDPEDIRGWDDIGEESGEAEVKRPQKKPEEALYAAVERDRERIRELTREERELYAPYIQGRAAREQLIRAIDSISMAAYTGNIVITGEEGMDTLTLARNMIQEVQTADSNFSGKVAKISGRALNQRNVRETLEQLKNGALIIMKAAGMEPGTARGLYQALQQENVGLIVVLEDTKRGMARLFAENPRLKESFTARVDVEALSDETLASFGKKYAREKEFSIDDLGILALRRKIEERQTIDHAVTVQEVKKIVDDAIRHASRRSFGHFVDILLARRYDEEDMVILTEKDFI